VLPGERSRQRDPASAGGDVSLVLLADSLDLPDNHRGERLGQHCDAIVASFSTPNEGLPTPWIYILDPQAHALHEPRTIPIEVSSDEFMGALKLIKEGSDLLSIEDDGEFHPSPRTSDPLGEVDWSSQHLVVEESECAGRLTLSGWTRVSFRGKIRQEDSHIGHSQLARVACPMVVHVVAGPSNVDFLGTLAEMALAATRPDALQ